MKKYALSTLLLIIIFSFFVSCAFSQNVDFDETVQSGVATASSEPEPQSLAPGSSIQGYKSPEDTIYAFVEAVKSGELNKITDTFCVNDYIDNYNSNHPGAESFSQPTYEVRMEEVYFQVVSFYHGFETSGFIKSFWNDLTSAGIEELMKEEKYKTLKVLRIDFPEKDLRTHQEYIDRLSEMDTKGVMGGGLYGADGWDYRTALLSLDKKTYYCGFHFWKYGEKYEIESLICPVVPMLMPEEEWPVYVMPCTEEEYLQLPRTS